MKKLDIKIMSNKKISFDLLDLGFKKHVEIHFPDLESASFKSWGDWGPMYEFNISHSDPIKIAYDQELRSLNQTILKIESPVMPEERRATPFSINIEDKDFNVSYRIFLNNEYSVEKIQIKKDKNEIKANNLSFEEKEMAHAM